MSAHTVTETHAIPTPSISMSYTYDDAFFYTDTESGNAIPTPSVLAQWVWQNAYNESIPTPPSEIPIPSILMEITDWNSGSQTFTPTYEESVSFSESIPKTVKPFVSDSVSFAESITKSWVIYKSISETVLFSESTSADSNTYRSIHDSIPFNELVSKTIYKYHLEYVPFVDTTAKRLTRSINDIISFVENTLQNFVWTKYIVDYIGFYEAPPRKIITHYIQDYLVRLDETVDKVLRSGSHIWFWHVDDRLYFREYINKQIEKYDTEQVEFSEDQSAYIRRNKLILFWKNEIVKFTESYNKTVKVFKSENVSFLMTYSKNSAYLIQDNITFIESFIKTVTKKVVDTIPFSEVVSTLLTVPLYFDAGRIEPQYVITDLRIYGGAEMQFYAGQTADIRWKHRRFDDDTLDDPDSHTVVIYDSRNVQRVAYDVTKLLKESTGVYKYYFTLPSDVIVGDWHAKITATKGTATTVLTIHFNVKEK